MYVREMVIILLVKHIIQKLRYAETGVVVVQSKRRHIGDPKIAHEGFGQE
jgi:hypothetical protein